MTKKDYEKIANVIKEVTEDVQAAGPGLIGNTPEQAQAAEIAIRYLAGRLAEEVFAPDNERFDEQKFLAAAFPTTGPVEIVI